MLFHEWQNPISTGGNGVNEGFLMEAPLHPFSPVKWVDVLGCGEKHRVTGTRAVKKTIAAFQKIFSRGDAEAQRRKWGNEFSSQITDFYLS
jgi:hypothetical protein